VKGGTYFPMTVKKHLRAQEIAQQNRLPCVYLVDSGGAFLPLQDEVFPDRDHFGRIFFNQARMSALGIPQVAVVIGSCTAGGAYVPAMSDESIIVKNQGTIFLAGPPLVKAATGEEVTPKNWAARCAHPLLGRGRPPTPSTTRSAHHRPAHRGHTQPGKDALGPRTPEEPLFDPPRWAGASSPPISRKPYDVREVIARIVDGSRFDEFKALYGTTLVTGFAHIHGMPRGHRRQQRRAVLGEARSRRALHRAVHAAQDPAVFLQNITGFMVGQASTSSAASPRTAPRWCTRWRPQRAEVHVVIGGSSAPATTACAAAPIQPRFNCGCGRTRASR
jgi:3-methylcrotonyl-CoA carboxylase beta subunit